MDVYVSSAFRNEQNNDSLIFPITLQNQMKQSYLLRQFLIINSMKPYPLHLPFRQFTPKIKAWIAEGGGNILYNNNKGVKGVGLECK